MVKIVRTDRHSQELIDEFSSRDYGVEGEVGDTESITEKIASRPSVSYLHTAGHRALVKLISDRFSELTLSSVVRESWFLATTIDDVVVANQLMQNTIHKVSNVEQRYAVHSAQFRDDITEQFFITLKRLRMRERL